MQRFIKIISLFLFLSFLSLAVRAQSSHKVIQRFDVSYQYFRIERSTLINSVDFLSRAGIFVDYVRTSHLNRRWNLYYQVGAGFNSFEATDSNTLESPYHIPWLAGLGLQYRFGRMRSMKWILGFEGGSEVYASLVGVSTYRLRASYSGRVKAGLAIMFKSLTASSAEIRGTFSYPVTPIELDGATMEYKGVVEGSVRMKFNYRSSWGVAAKVRFEDYQAENKSVTYFNTRAMFGAFWNF